MPLQMRKHLQQDARICKRIMGPALQGQTEMLRQF